MPFFFKILEKRKERIPGIIKEFQVTFLKRVEADAIDVDAKAEARELRDRSGNEAAEILSNAEARAKAMVKDADKRTATLVTDAEERLSQIRIEREAVAGYFESLRTVLSQAEKVATDK